MIATTVALMYGSRQRKYYSKATGFPSSGSRASHDGREGVGMKTRVSNPSEQRCPACDGTGVLAVIQPVQPGHRIYPPPCKECGGKGRIPKTEQ
jgi:DnaJ-class molecular chaperone